MNRQKSEYLNSSGHAKVQLPVKYKVDFKEIVKSSEEVKTEQENRPLSASFL